MGLNDGILDFEGRIMVLEFFFDFLGKFQSNLIK